jgi:hypothetical protein
MNICIGRFIQYVQLDRLGIRYGMLPNKPPFSLSINRTLPMESRQIEHLKETVTNIQLVEAFLNQDDFDHLYLVMR